MRERERERERGREGEREKEREKGRERDFFKLCRAHALWVLVGLVTTNKTFFQCHGGQGKVLMPLFSVCRDD